jgi:hypothetical protein
MTSYYTNHGYQSIPFDEELCKNSPSSILRHPVSSSGGTGTRRVLHDDVVPEWRGLAITLCVIAFSMAVAATVLGIYAFEHDGED